MTKNQVQKGDQKEKRVNLFAKFAMWAIVAFSAFMYAGTYCYATANWGENIGKWFMDQIFWFGIIVIALIAIPCLMKKNYIGAGITIVGGGIILFFVTNPEKIYSIGELFGNIIMNGS